MSDDYWRDWLVLLLLMHDRRMTYREVLTDTFEAWYDRCVMVNHNQMVGRLHA